MQFMKETLLGWLEKKVIPRFEMIFYLVIRARQNCFIYFSIQRILHARVKNGGGGGERKKRNKLETKPRFVVFSHQPWFDILLSSDSMRISNDSRIKLEMQNRNVNSDVERKEEYKDKKKEKEKKNN